MIDFYLARQKLKELSEILELAEGAFDLDNIRSELGSLKEKQNQPGFFNNVAEVSTVGKRINFIEKRILKVSALKEKINDADTMIDLLEEMRDENESEVFEKELSRLTEEIEELKLEMLLKGKYDDLNAIISLHAGAGGTEAQDWTEMLLRMYTRYAERHDFSVKTLDFLEGDEAGVKSVTILVSGENAYGFLKAEMGVHRLVRISPFDSNKRRHTSFASVEVMPEIEESEDIKISPDELKVDTYRSSGAGGQHVNKTESAIRITHIPTGIIVACQNERSQIQNREVAMKMLRSKLIEKREREQLEEAQNIKGELKKIEWGSQIRSYVFCPYTLVKDHRTGFENSNVNAVMDGDLDGFINDYLVKS